MRAVVEHEHRHLAQRAPSQNRDCRASTATSPELVVVASSRPARCAPCAYRGWSSMREREHELRERRRKKSIASRARATGPRRPRDKIRFLRTRFAHERRSSRTVCVDRAVAARRALFRQGRGALPSFLRIWPRPPSRARRARLAGSAFRRVRDRRARAFLAADAARDRRRHECLLARRRLTGQGDRAHHQPRRQGGRVLAQGALRRHRGDRARLRVHPLRVHVGGHQQPVARPRPRARPARRPAADAARHRVGPARDRARQRRASDALPYARPGGDAHDARQGDGQRLRAPRAPDRGDRACSDQGQDQWRGRQLQRARGGVSGRRLGAARRARRQGRWASSSIPTRRRSSRTTTWRSSSTPSRARTPS